MYGPLRPDNSAWKFKEILTMAQTIRSIACIFIVSIQINVTSKHRTFILIRIFALNYTDEHLHGLLVNPMWYVLICIWPLHNITTTKKYEKKITDNLIYRMLNRIFKRERETERIKSTDGFALVPINYIDMPTNDLSIKLNGKTMMNRAIGYDIEMDVDMNKT